MKFLKKDRVLSIILLAISMFFYFNVQKLKSTGYVGDPGPKMFPYLGIVVLIICAVILFIKPETKEQKQLLTKEQAVSAAKLLGVYALIFLLMWTVGYIITAPIILFILCYMFSKVSEPGITLKKNVIRSIIYAIVLSAGLYLLYVVALKTQMPKGILWQALKK